MKYLRCFLLFGLHSAALFGQLRLEYNLEKGDVFHIAQEARQTIVQEVEGESHEISNTLSGHLEFRVVEVRNSVFVIDVTFRDLNLAMNSSIQGELLNVHAKIVPKGDVQARIFNSLLNVPIRIIMARTGDILEVSGGDGLVAKMTKASGLDDDLSLSVMRKSLEEEFGSQALAESYEQLTYIYPEKRVGIGESWENEFTGKLTALNRWTLEEASDVQNRIRGTSEVVMDVSEPETVMKLTGNQETMVVSDPKTGFIRLMTVKGKSSGISSIAQVGSQEIPTTIESTTRYELIMQ